MKSDDENETEIVSQALPVAKISQNYDPSIAPATGEEYLSRVRAEASKNKIVVADIDTRPFEKNRNILFFHPNLGVEKRPQFKAKREWQLEKCVEFSLLRDKVRKEKEQFLKNLSASGKKYTMKSLKSKKDWYSFCYGKKSSSDEQQEKEPCLSILYNMDQNCIVTLFDYHIEWLQTYGYSRNRFQWMFCLMCFLEKPLLPETHSSLRDLARECIKIRSKLNDPGDEILTELNLFIAIIGRYFEQTDLADEDL